MTQEEEIKSPDRLLEFDLSAELNHGIAVSNLAYAVAKELGQDEEFCYQLAIAGILHDIGKLKLTGYINGQENDPLLIEELKYVRMHSTLMRQRLESLCVINMDCIIMAAVTNGKQHFVRLLQTIPIYQKYFLTAKQAAFFVMPTIFHL